MRHLPLRRRPMPFAGMRLSIAAAFAVTLAGCGLVSTTAPPATPFDFPGIAVELAQAGLELDAFTSGEPGCDDAALAPTAIRFTASGLDQDEPTPLYLYIFRTREAFERRRADVDRCAQAYADDREAFGSIEASPYVLAGPGPWAPEFEATLRSVLTESAGTGG